MPDEAAETKDVMQHESATLVEHEESAKPATPLERFLRKFRETAQSPRRPSQAMRKELGKDKSKSLFLIVAAAIGILLFFLAIFSSPQKTRRQQMWQHDGQADLGRRVTPGQLQQQAGSVTPMLNAKTQSQATLSSGEVTPEDVGRTSQAGLGNESVASNATASPLVPPSLASGASAHGGPTPADQQAARPNGSQQYALSHISFPDTALQKEYAKAGQAPDFTTATSPNNASTSPKSDDDLKKPSLVFVRSENAVSSLARNLSPVRHQVATPVTGSVAPPSLDSILPPGTRLVARLESPASTAVAGPVVAAIEYNYEQDGEIVVPAGSKAIGKLEQANPSGDVSLHFTSMELPDGTSEKIDGISMGLNYGPVKGLVNGRRRGMRFLVQAMTGLGTMASYLVGAGNFSGPLSESGLLRERIADNVGIAGQNELNQLSFNQNITVTVPGNTRFYIVLQKTDDASGQTSTARRRTDTSLSPRTAQSAPNLMELRELLELQREMSQLYPQGTSAPPQPSASQNSQ